MYKENQQKKKCKTNKYCFFSIGNITMIQVIGILMGSDPAPFFANLFLAYKEADWLKAQRKLGTINVRKINNFFRFIDDGK